MENKKDMNIIFAVIICLVLAGVLIFITINNKVNMPSNDTNKIDTSDNTISLPAANAPASNPTPVANPAPSGATTGQVAKLGDTVSMNYTGWLENGAAFDSNVDPKFKHVEPFVFTLGAGQVIAGWDKGIVGMKVGERKTLKILPADGYGASGQGPIPPNATLIFNVELVAIKK